MNQLSPGIAERLAYYVVHGGKDEAIKELNRLKNPSRALALHCVQEHFNFESFERRPLFESVETLPAEVWRRLARVYEMASRGAKRRLFRPFLDPELDWLEILMQEATGFVWPGICKPSRGVTAEVIEALLEMENLPKDLLLRAALLPPMRGDERPGLEPAFLNLEGLAGSVLRHRDALFRAIQESDSRQSVYALRTLRKLKVPVSDIASELVELALSPGKQVREFARSMLDETKDAARDAIQRKLTLGSPAERGRAAELLWAVAGQDAKGILLEQVAADKSSAVRRVIQGILDNAKAGETVTEDDALRLPPVAPIDDGKPLSEETRRAWRECFERLNAGLEKCNRRPASLPPRMATSPEMVEKSFAAIEIGEPTEALLSSSFDPWLDREMVKPFRNFWHRSELQIVHLARFFIQIGSVIPEKRGSAVGGCGVWTDEFFPEFHRSHPGIGLRELASFRRLRRRALVSTVWRSAV